MYFKNFNPSNIFNYKNKKLLNILDSNRLYLIFVIFLKIFKYNFFFSNSRYNKYSYTVMYNILKKLNINNSFLHIKKFNVKGVTLSNKNHTSLIYTNLFDDFSALFNILQIKENFNKIYYKNGF
jgi:hypothetical protein